MTEAAEISTGGGETGEGAAASDDARALLKAIRKIVRANDMRSRALAKSSGLTGPQLVILMAVAELGEVTTRALADHVELSPATVVMVLENLEHRAIVERYRSGEDRRVVYTRLTAKGREMVSHAPGLFGAAFAERFASLPGHRRDEIVDTLTALAEMMGPGSAKS
jgi:DNA-binding MarR family transcriptional regulator